MVGTYHQFGTFISGVASLPRVVILTLHDVSLTPKNVDAKGAPVANGQLVLQGTVKTYRYLEEDESAEAKAANAKSVNGKPGTDKKPAAATGGQK